MANPTSCYDVSKVDPGLRMLVYRLSLIMILMVLHPASFVTASNVVLIQMTSTHSNQQYQPSLAKDSSYAFSIMNTSVCGIIVDGALSGGTVSKCNVESFADKPDGVEATVKVEAALDGKTEDERYRSIKTAVVQSAADSVSWQIAESDITLVESNNVAPPVSGTSITMRVLSTRTDLGYNSELTDPKKYSYDITENAMCADVIDAVKSVGAVEKCEAASFKPANPGVLGNLTISITVYNKEEIDGFLAASSAILTAADARGNWNIGPGEIILIPKTTQDSDRSDSSRLTQLPAVLLLSFLIQYGLCPFTN